MEVSQILSLLNFSEFYCLKNSQFEVKKLWTNRDSKSIKNKSWKYKKTTLYVICDEALTNGTVARSYAKTPHSTGRKGIPRVEHKMPRWYDGQTCIIYTHVYKNIPDDPLHPKHIAAKEVGYVRGTGGDTSKT
ncbi:hypothetical protein MKX01_022051 [Papaver californicum]|nr:hypothetical protein MKX01_022051 [Papaver californicum]